jgi:hypothetical protein
MSSADAEQEYIKKEKDEYTDQQGRQSPIQHPAMQGQRLCTLNANLTI